MDSLTHFYSENVYFDIHYSYSLEVMALFIFSKFLSVIPTLTEFRIQSFIRNCVAPSRAWYRCDILGFCLNSCKFVAQNPVF